jgi:type I restriction-modification system DNA methylase subunit
MHAHTHQHDHSHARNHDYAAANREHFDGGAAEEYDKTPGALEATQKIASVILKLFPFNKDTTTVLDYACGTGSLSFCPICSSY